MKDQAKTITELQLSENNLIYSLQTAFAGGDFVTVHRLEEELSRVRRQFSELLSKGWTQSLRRQITVESKS